MFYTLGEGGTELVHSEEVDIFNFQFLIEDILVSEIFPPR